MVESTALEMRRTGNRTVGSNPTLSANAPFANARCPPWTVILKGRQQHAKNERVTTRRRDFKSFHRKQAVAFKQRLSDALNARTGERVSKAPRTTPRPDC